MQPDTHQYAEQTQQMLAWLGALGKNKTAKSSLEEQLQTLSLSYKNAQEKLLNLEKQLYYESLLNEKQRSIIDILKYIINGSLDDETILTYLVEMQEQANSELDRKYQIRSELEQIKQMVTRRKGQAKKAEGLRSVAVADLKKEIVKCNQVKRELMEDLDRTLSDKGNLEATVEQLTLKMEEMTASMDIKSKEIQKLQQMNNNSIIDKENLQLRNEQLHSQIREKQQSLSSISQLLAKFNSKSDKQDTIDPCTAIKKLEQKCSKYRNLSKQLSQQLRLSTHSQQLIHSLKLYLPEQAYKLCEEYQKTSNKHLLKQVESIARLQVKKYQQLENCQEEVWRLKAKLLREGESVTKTRHTRDTLGSLDKQNLDSNLRGDITQFLQQVNI